VDSVLYSINGIIVSFVAYIALSWIVGESWFYEFVIATISSIIISLIAIETTKNTKINLASNMKLEGKEIITDIGAYIGKIIGIDKKAGTAIAQTPIGTRIPIKLERISSVGERVIVKQ
jgi:sporulation protein YlmC with PRC-barrel domain